MLLFSEFKHLFQHLLCLLQPIIAIRLTALSIVIASASACNAFETEVGAAEDWVAVLLENS